MLACTRDFESSNTLLRSHSDIRLRNGVVVSLVLVKAPSLRALGLLQSEHHCCNTCDDVREAYRRKGWAFSDPDSIAQVWGASHATTCSCLAPEELFTIRRRATPEPDLSDLFKDCHVRCPRLCFDRA